MVKLDKKKNFVLMIVLCAFLVSLGTFAEAASNYPNKNISVVVPTAEGGAADRVIRAVTTVWRKYLGVNFQNTFHPGASGEVGYTIFLERPADGYTLLSGNIAPEVMMYALQEPRYKFPEDFIYFACMDSDPAVLWIPNNSPFQNLNQLIEEGKKRPINVATSRFPHPSTLAVLLLGELTGAQFNIIPYGGGNAARTAGLTNEVDAVTTFLSSSLDFASEIRFVVIFQQENKWKDISQNAPTPKEALGVELPDFGGNRAWAVSRAFKDQHPEDYKKLVDSFEQAFRDPALKEEWKKVGMDPQFLEYRNEEESMKMAETMIETALKYKNVLKKEK
jgi:tripartite-type tricarboxylate transporter receptor subunit TctC